ncbi:class III lanthionine synthetase LanKC [Amycolatopsis sp. PS_44_ISF1]|uniref:class III lanthionine synthetase LanKC n=1 Tax=Amycolatopsis sp. PS_44_ISF1 TaxID=2974917 RepID=UPI0028DE3909|nr:class III lanthionine synthetase LanKC [Amycolatopsis sp. PS_44_ISF1]MDT8912303.1 class III lanthionine synthetase LanKC [Amycolatopsis sp. PS_44_ISF1]
MTDTLTYALTDDDLYLPIDRIADPGTPFAPAAPPDGWTRGQEGVWAMWTPPGARLPAQGWKVHVSTTLDRAQSTLDTVAAICADEEIPFKHLAARLFFLYLHHKHGSRVQAGKFLAIYPGDDATARRVLDRLAAARRGEEGPYVLTDRRYADCATVYYRYGAFHSRTRLRPDGTRELLVTDADGADRVDERQAAFRLPAGVRDPFASPAEAGPPGPLLLGPYEIVRVLQHSNAGGSYEGKDTRDGTRVFVKEARAANGLSWDGVPARERLRAEHRSLVRIHVASPGLCPEPLDYFQEWEHEFLVTEFVEGDTLYGWVARNSPLLEAGRERAAFAAYYDQCARLFDRVDQDLAELHEIGYVFGDLTPTNIMVEDGVPRLIDFETAHVPPEEPLRVGTPVFHPPRGFVTPQDPFAHDRFARASVTLFTLSPAYAVLQRSPGNLELIRRDLAEEAPLPPRLWRQASRYVGAWAPDGRVPGIPPGLDAASFPDRTAHLQHLRDRVAQELLSSADPGNPDWVFPPSPQAHRTNHLGLAHGLAGVVHALAHAGTTVPDHLVHRLRAEVHARHDELPPGMFAGTAGVADVLAQLGHLDEAAELLAAAKDHPLTAECATLGDGAAGVGLALLRLNTATADRRHLDWADRIGHTLHPLARADSPLGPRDPRGLANGRAGLALFLHRLAAVTGDDSHRHAGLRLLHAELDRGLELPSGALSFADDERSSRAMPYLAIGSAGVGLALTRYAATVDDERLAGAMPRIVADAAKPFTIAPGLFQGLAGLACFFAEHAAWTGEPGHRATARRLASGLARYAVPHNGGFRFLGGDGSHFSADLATGSAGVLLALSTVLRADTKEAH